MAKVKPMHEILIADLTMVHDSIASTEHKRKLSIWRERHLFKIRTYEKIFEELAEHKHHVVNALKFVSTFTSQISC
jgi:hypothetical protein